MTLWTAINSTAIVILGAVTFLLVRQLGLVLQRLGPQGARGAPQGPRIQENVSSYLGSQAPAGRPRLMIFGSTACPVCGVVEEASRHIAPHWAPVADVVMMYDVPKESDESTKKTRNFFVAYDAELRQLLSINTIPFAVMVDGSGIVKAKGVVNNGSHVESLLESFAGHSPVVSVEPVPTESLAEGTAKQEGTVAAR